MYEQIGPYVLMESIGRGAFASVRSGRNIHTQQPVAIKIIKKDLVSEDDLKKELNFIESFNHPFICKFYQYFSDEINYYLVMEYISGGSLLEYISMYGVIPEWKARHYMIELVLALEYLHNEKHIAHRDLKSENIMLDSYDNIKIIDFGLSKMFKTADQLLVTPCGSPAYAAPEMLTGKPYTPSTDLWSIGVILYQMLYGHLPFDDTNVQRLLQKIVYTEPVFRDNISNASLNLIKRLMMKNPEHRISLNEIKESSFMSTRDINFLSPYVESMELWRQMVQDSRIRNEIAKKIDEIEDDISDEYCNVLFLIYSREIEIKMLQSLKFQMEQLQIKQDLSNAHIQHSRSSLPSLYHKFSKNEYNKIPKEDTAPLPNKQDRIFILTRKVNTSAKCNSAKRSLVPQKPLNMA